MKLECEKLIVFVICTVITFKQCLAAVIINSTPGEAQLRNYGLVLTTCTLPTEEDTEAYCLPVRNCLTILMLLNATAVRARRCGPHNENLTNPYVCCEKKYIELEANLTSAVIPPPSQSGTEIYPPPSSTTTQRPQWRTPTATKRRPQWQTTTTQPSPTVPFTPVNYPTQKTETLDTKNPFEGCGHQDITTRILGGKPSSQKEFPWLARLLRRDSRGEVIFACTGALISSRVVLTTAHCLVSDSLQNVGDLYAVSLGEHETECNSAMDACLLNKKTIMVSTYIAHSQYNISSRNHDNDIGLIILRKDVTFSDYISPICLMENDIETSEYYIAGWGKTETGAASGVKLKAELPSFSWEQCAKKYRTIKIDLTPRQICAGGVEGMDTCQGDSGGPLMVRREDMSWYVAGVVSFGLGCGRKGWPAVYVYVPSYIDWIKNTAKQNTP